MVNSIEMEAKTSEASGKASGPSDSVSGGVAKRHKSLTSPILSPQDIAQEILERSKRKHTSQQPTTNENRDVVFTMKLTQRLAKRVVREDVKLEKMVEEKTPDLDARELLCILQDGAETHYLEGTRPPKTPRLSRGSYSRGESKIDPELEKKIALKQLMEFSRKRGRPKKENNNNEVKEPAKESPSSLVTTPSGKPKNRELEMLLQDEGAINMLYAIEKGGEDVAKPSQGLLPSKRRMKKALIKKAQEVKEAILGGASLGLNLRYRALEKSRKPSVDSVDSEVEAFSPQLPAEASKIIRRHSSSSSYSSRSNSPSRRASLDREKSPQPVPPEPSPPRSNGVSSPEFTPPPPPPPPPPSVKTMAERLIEKKCKEFKLRPEQSDVFSRLMRQNGFGLKERLQTELKAAMSASPKDTLSRVEVDQEVSENKDPVKAQPNEAIWKMVEEDWLMDDVEPTQRPVVPATDIQPSSDLEAVQTGTIPRKLTEETSDSSKEGGHSSESAYVYQLDSCSHRYKELRLKRIDNLVHVDIVPVSTYLPQAFNSQVLRELTTLLEELSQDVRCRTLLFTCCSNQPQPSDQTLSLSPTEKDSHDNENTVDNGVGNKLFSNGLDLPALLHQNLEIRKNVASEMATALKQFVCKLCMMRKVVVAGVDGDAVGFGTVLLAYCDFVIATERSTFSTPYAQLGYLPEAAATLALPHAVGNRCANNMLLGCARLTAPDAQKCGLVTKIFPVENFQQELITSSLPLSRQSSQSVESAKALLLHGVRTRLGSVLALEVSLLQQHWTSEECQTRIRAWAKRITAPT